MGKHGNPEGRGGESTAQTTFRTGRILVARQADAKRAERAPKADKVWLRGKGK